MVDTPTDVPSEIRLRKRSACLDLHYPDGRHYSLPFEYLRVFSPSAEVRGHGPGQAVLQHGKRDVRIVRIEPVGHYALKLFFSDGHQTGIYSWSYLVELGVQHEQRWARYLADLSQQGLTREP